MIRLQSCAEEDREADGGVRGRAQGAARGRRRASASTWPTNAGTLEAGKLADLLVVDSDPLDDITLLQDQARLLLIMQGGRALKDLVTR